MENNNLTIWQKLSQYFGPHGLSNQEYPIYTFDKKELLRTQSKSEYEREKLQAQQTWYLANQWAKIENNMYSQAVYYEPTRLSSVYDYESMEYTPEISTALDIYAEESTTTNEDGEILGIFSESKRIRSILTDLFINVLDVNTNLSMWTRNTCKYGDNFVYLKLDPEKGIVGCQQLPNIEIQRIEPGSSEKSPLYLEKSEPTKSLHFRWTNKSLEFQPWEIAHFRILGDDRKLPYGTCLKYDTLIDTEYDVKQIKDIEKGDLVWSFDLQTQEKELSKVLDVINSGIKKCYKLQTKNNFVEASEEHRILIYQNEEFVYKNVLDILVGDVLVIDEPKMLPKQYILEEIISITDVGEHETYDIYVENENHNFYANGIVVHNSMLEKARRTWKQLLLGEDAMLIYRTSRAPERRVFKIFVGNMSDEDVEPYVNRIANKFKREQIVDSKSGNVDMRYNQMAVDQDYFVPVRDPAAPSPIETLPGGTNMGEISDIEYIQRKLVTALRIPKAFLGFEESVGDGKTLALQDIRFARTINRIQKSMISELNKIAIIHLYLLGFDDELTNFKLTLTNPSTQADLLKVDIWKEKIQLYKDAVSDPGSGIQPVSATWAKKHIFGFSDEDIRVDLQQQRIERAVGEELKATPLIIKKTGLFDNLDKLYADVTGVTTTTATQSTTETPPMPDLGGGMDITPSELPVPETGTEEAPATETPMESRFNNLNLLIENDIIEGKKYLDLSQGAKSLKDLDNEIERIV